MTVTPPRLLFVDVKAPTPDHDAASQRSMQLLAQLIDWGFSVDFAALFPVETDLPSAIADLELTALADSDETSLRAHLAAQTGRYDIVLLCWTRVASRIIDIARACNPSAFVVFDSVDVNHVREYRHARVSGNARILRRALATKARELHCLSRADCTLATTEVDADALRAACPAARVEVVTLQAPPIPALPEPPWSSRGGSLFLGNLQAAANVDAALHLVNDILPEPRRMGGDPRISLVGTTPPAVVARLAKHPDVAVPGHVADLAPLFAAHRLFVCPLRFGSGLKGKLLTAMALGLPAVVTPTAAEGMGLTHQREVLVAEAPEDYAEAMIRLQRDPELSAAMATAARRHVSERHGSRVFLAQMRRVFCA